MVVYQVTALLRSENIAEKTDGGILRQRKIPTAQCRDPPVFTLEIELDLDGGGVIKVILTLW